MTKRSRSRHDLRPRLNTRDKLAMVLVLGVLLALAGVAGSRISQAQAGASNLPPAKAQLKAQEQQQIAAAQARHQIKSAPQAPAAEAAPVRQAGIVDMHQGPFSATQFTVNNFWQGPVGANWVLVYAGASRNLDGSTGAGALVLYTETPNASGDFDLHELGVYTAPQGAGALTITAVQGTSMRLQAAAGNSLVFDLGTASYK